MVFVLLNCFVPVRIGVPPEMVVRGVSGYGLRLVSVWEKTIVGIREN